VRGGTSTTNSAITMVNRCKGERGRHNYRSRYGFENSSSEGDMYSSNEDPYGEYGESFGVGVSTNTRDSTSSKYSTSTSINHCNGERGQHNYRPKNEYNKYSSSEPDYSLDEMPYEASYKTSDHGSSPHARDSAHSPSECLEDLSGEVEPVRMACMVVYHHNIEGSEDEEWEWNAERFECPQPAMCGSPDIEHWRPFPEGENFIQEDDNEDDSKYADDGDENGNYTDNDDGYD
jgi:hypothetical protein